jgi:hypothetical protein
MSRRDHPRRAGRGFRCLLFRLPLPFSLRPPGRALSQQLFGLCEPRHRELSPPQLRWSRARGKCYLLSILFPEIGVRSSTG